MSLCSAMLSNGKFAESLAADCNIARYCRRKRTAQNGLGELEPAVVGPKHVAGRQLAENCRPQSA
jgi:hypothetical protein